MSKHWSKSKEAVWEELGGEVLLVSPKDGASWRLNATASAIWKHCNGAASLSGLALAFARQARACGANELRSIEGDLNAFCEKLQASGLLVAAPVPVAAAGSQTICFRGHYSLPSATIRPLGAGPRKRPSPRGNSGPG